jgi:endonuclease YncB( thermonuclease family)
VKTKTKLILLTGTALLTLVLGSVGIAAAQDNAPPPSLGKGEERAPARRGALVYGVIKVVEGDSLELATPVGPVTAITDANTRFRISEMENADLDDLSAGDYVGATGWWEEGGGIFHAFGVGWMETERVLPLPGRLSDISGDTLTIETQRGDATIRIDDDTVYRIRGVEKPNFDDLEAGMNIVVQGTLNPDGSLLARMVNVPWVGPRPIRLQGKVLAVEGDTFTVRTARDRQLVVATDETTEFRIPGADTPSIADLQVGDRVAGEGVVGENGMDSGQPRGRATLVIVLPKQVARLVGEVIAAEGSALELDTPGGGVSVLTDGNTVLRIPGVEEPTVADVEIGAQATAIGTWVDETTSNAVIVGVRGDRPAGQRGTVRGRVIRVEADRFILGTLHGPMTVLVDGETQYRVPGVEASTLADITVGAAVDARGTWGEDGTLQAVGVVMLDGGRAKD